ncbi:hypothetical protein BDF19DRAFT_434900 [Syncephalis fuscata]|nr:hypothetical protein BDF19DRAFT_434900 [Syncephalis fuscata]
MHTTQEDEEDDSNIYHDHQAVPISVAQNDISSPVSRQKSQSSRTHEVYAVNNAAFQQNQRSMDDEHSMEKSQSLPHWRTARPHQLDSEPNPYDFKAIDRNLKTGAITQSSSIGHATLYHQHMTTNTMPMINTTPYRCLLIVKRIVYWHAHEYSHEDYHAVEMASPSPYRAHFAEESNNRASQRLTQMFKYAVGDETRAKRMSLATQDMANTVIHDREGQYRPLFMASIIAVQVVVLLVEMVVNYQLTGSFIATGDQFNYLIGPGTLAWIRSGARFTIENMSLADVCGFGGFPSNHPDQWYRFIIPMFLHGGIIHLLFNGIFQWRTGMQMEREWVSPISMISLGASGCVFALLAASMIDLLQHWNETANRGRQMAELIIIIIISFVLGLLPGIDNFAHIGGFLRWIGALVTIALFAVLFTVFYTNTDPQSTCPWCKYLNCLPIDGWCDALDNPVPT